MKGTLSKKLFLFYPFALGKMTSASQNSFSYLLTSFSAKHQLMFLIRAWQERKALCVSQKTHQRGKVLGSGLDADVFLKRQTHTLRLTSDYQRDNEFCRWNGDLSTKILVYHIKRFLEAKKQEQIAFVNSIETLFRCGMIRYLKSVSMLFMNPGDAWGVGSYRS
jgi:hypothetical protein